MSSEGELNQNSLDDPPGNSHPSDNRHRIQSARQMTLFEDMLALIMLLKNKEVKINKNKIFFFTF